jgi:hypothetical protein
VTEVNKPSVMEHVEFINKYFTEEVEAGRMSGPYSKEELEGFFPMFPSLN